MNQPAALGVLDIKKTKGLLDQSSWAGLGSPGGAHTNPALPALFLQEHPSFPPHSWPRKERGEKNKTRTNSRLWCQVSPAVCFFLPREIHFVPFDLAVGRGQVYLSLPTCLGQNHLSCFSLPHTGDKKNYLSMLRKNIWRKQLLFCLWHCLD